MNMRWIVNFTLIIAVFGTIFGLVLGGLNPWTSPAEANRINMETTHQQAVYELEERLAAAQTESEILAIQRKQELLNAQYERDIQILAQDVVNKQRMADTVINLVIFAGVTTGIVAAIGALILAIAKAAAILRSAPKTQPVVKPSRSIPTMQVVKPLPERESYDPLVSPQQWYEKRLAERQQEIAAQKEFNDEMIGRMKAVLNPALISKEEYNKRPLAGD